MHRAPLPSELRRTERKTRLSLILSACEEVGMVPIAGSTIHALAYLTDALAPVWRLPISNAQLLKRETRPFFPELQRELDHLVGLGVVLVDSLKYAPEGSRGWRLAATYHLNEESIQGTLNLAAELQSQAPIASFVREVVLAATGLGDDELNSIGVLDAAYSDVTTGIGEVLNLEEDPAELGGETRINDSAAVANRFEDLAGANLNLSSAELIHLYVRHLYSRANVA